MPLLNSSNLTGCEYDQPSHTLTITFQNGGEYAYRNVPESVYENLQSAPSPGSYFAASIRGKFQTERLS